MTREQPNVIVIVSDTFRPDHLGVNGNARIATPELDRWVQQSITFDRAMVSSFPTIPMRTDWFTGRFGHPRHGWRGLEDPPRSLPRVLNQAGYVTQLIADTTHLLRSGFHSAFQHFHYRRGHEGDVPMARGNDPVRPVVTDRRKTRVEYRSNPDWPSSASVHAHTNFRQRYEDEAHCALLADDACRWVEDNHRGGPFFLWLDFFDVHEPWYPPAYLLEKYQPGYDGAAMPHPNYHDASVYEPEELANLQARYAAMCTLLSKHVGRVLRVIEDANLLENSIVVFMSDHGIYLGERGRTGKSLIHPEAFDCFPFYRELTDICWSMHVPASLGLRTLVPGSRVSHVIQAPDLMPTLFELCGVEAPGEVHERIEGQSLVPLLTGESDAPLRPVSMTAWTMSTHHSREMLGSRMPTVTDGRWSLLLHEPPDAQPPELYDLADDPAQTRNVIGARRDEAQRLHRLMLDWLAAHEADAATLERLSAANVGLA